MIIKCRCGNDFKTRPGLVAQGKGIYCSRACSYRFRRSPGSEAQQNRPRYEDGDHYLEVVRNPELGPCHEWRGHRNRHDYGMVWRDGRRWLAHRKVWADEMGPISEGLLVLHRCDNPPCVRIDHLYVGTHKQNSQDMLSRGRAYTGEHAGEKNPAAKLTAQQIAEIRSLYVPRKITQAYLASLYGVTQSTISEIVLRKTWRE